ncbi:MAG: hypothetical protein K6G87_03965 [Butyrivibrio sp.]|uniref:hypothetical protein n=1 Tax=Butyrivibrio sp. TaxID=28121 RepID=UPI0025E24A12|nr:hypothetical protein [Butyrivibrio sp.]MCR5770374.1 hypothetical protein [Butyrivibrio sp.]
MKKSFIKSKVVCGIMASALLLSACSSGSDMISLSDEDKAQAESSLENSASESDDANTEESSSAEASTSETSTSEANSSDSNSSNGDSVDNESASDSSTAASTALGTTKKVGKNGGLSEDELVEKAVKEAGADKEEARAYITDDFNDDGFLEAFVYIGEEPDEFGEAFGNIWYVDKESCEVVVENAYIAANKVEEIINSFTMEDGKIFVSITESYTTECASYLFYVDENGAERSVIFGRGAFSKPDYVDGYALTVSMYDGEIDYEKGNEDDKGMCIGHTWKNYYFYYDEETGDFKEYVGTSITKEELAKICGYDVAAEIEAEGFEVGDIYKRDNGIININYSETTEDDTTIYVSYHNATYNTNTKEFVDIYGSGENTWQASDFGGSYEDRIIKE